MTEKGLERKLRLAVERLGGLCLKLSTPGFTGIPDRLVILPGGKIWFVEMKKENLVPDPGGRQEYVINKLRGLGCNAIPLNMETIDSFIKWLNQ